MQGASQATIIDSGSTNRPGVTIVVNASGDATATERSGAAHSLKLNADQCKQLIDAVDAAAPLDALPAKHCFKSVSFGSSLYVECDGHRSPDLSCPGQQDAHCAALQTRATALLQAVRQQIGNAGGPPVRRVRPLAQ